MSKLQPVESVVHIAGLPLMDDEHGQQVRHVTLRLNSHSATHTNRKQE